MRVWYCRACDLTATATPAALHRWVADHKAREHQEAA